MCACVHVCVHVCVCVRTRAQMCVCVCVGVCEWESGWVVLQESDTTQQLNHHYHLSKEYHQHHIVRRMGQNIYSVQFSCTVVSDSLQPHGLQHARLPCPSPAPGVYSNSCPLSPSSVVLFSSHLQSFPASGSFQRLLKQYILVQ